MAGIDILIITALKMEFEAVREAGLRGHGNTRILSWADQDTDSATPYLRGELLVQSGESISVGLARPTRMGTVSTSPIASALVERLKPRCLAMSGVCAGNPKDLALGDVVLAELAYQYDEGRRLAEGIEFDHRQVPMNDEWLRTAQDLVPTSLSCYGPATDHERQLWLMERLSRAEDPAAHPARPRYFDNSSWTETIEALTNAGLIVRQSVTLVLTEKGAEYIGRIIADDIDGPQKLPISLIVGPMASGNVVVKDGLTWDMLKQHGVRTVTGLEMEAATIANVASRLRVPNWVVVKGVMDHADHRKDNRYKPFAATASAEVLFSFLSARFKPVGRRSQLESLSSRVKAFYVIGGATGNTSSSQIESIRANDTFEALGRSVAHANSELVVCSPFPDSADFWAIRGYVESGSGTVVHLHSPRHDRVRAARAELDEYLGEHSVRMSDWYYPPPEDKKSWSQAWLLCQLQALDQSDAVISVGGRPGGTATTLLHLAEAKRKLVVPLPFLDGPSRKLYEAIDWTTRYPECDFSVLKDPRNAGQAVLLADQMVAAGMRLSAGYRWPPRIIFICRARQDSTVGDQLAIHLRAAGFQVFLGDDEITDYRMMEPAIEQAILRSDVFLALWSAHFAISRFCSDELELALERSGVGEVALLLFSLDGTSVVPRAARGLPSAVTRSSESVIKTMMEILADEAPPTR